MSVLDEYAGMKIRIMAAVSGAMPEIAKGLQEAIEESAEERVYSYEATPEAMEMRRGLLGSKENLVAAIGNDFVEIQNTTNLRTEEGTGETQVVEEATPGYAQPYPRPFMEPALQDYVASGEPDHIIAQALRGAGFEVVENPVDTSWRELPF